MTTTTTTTKLEPGWKSTTELLPRSERRPLMSEAMDELTGYDELAIEKRYGAIIELLQGAKYMRALAFSQELHDGAKEEAAYKKVTGLRQAEIANYFTTPLDDPADQEDTSADDDDAPDPGPGRRPVADAPQA